jgi:hypothetical protein
MATSGWTRQYGREVNVLRCAGDEGSALDIAECDTLSWIQSYDIGA